MEPLRKCRTAKFFAPVPGSVPPKVRAHAAAAAVAAAAFAHNTARITTTTAYHVYTHARTCVFVWPRCLLVCCRGLQYTPIMNDPPCSRCPMSLSHAPVAARTICSNCGCMRATLYDLATEELVVPDVSMVRITLVAQSALPSLFRASLRQGCALSLCACHLMQDDFMHVLVRSKPTVATRELKRYDDFTAEFGVEGA